MLRGSEIIYNSNKIGFLTDNLILRRASKPTDCKSTVNRVFPKTKAILRVKETYEMMNISHLLDISNISIADLDFKRAMSNNIKIENAIVEIEESHIADNKMKERTIQKLLNNTDDYTQDANLGGLTSIPGAVLEFFSSRIRTVIGITAAISLSTMAFLVILLAARCGMCKMTLSKRSEHDERDNQQQVKLLVADKKTHQNLYPMLEIRG